MWLCRLEQDVPLLPERELDDAFRQQRGGQHHLLVGHRNIVDAQAAALDLPPRFAVRRDETGIDEGREDTDACFKFSLRNIDGRQAVGERAFLEGLACRLRSGICCIAAVHYGRRFGGESSSPR